MSRRSYSGRRRRCRTPQPQPLALALPFDEDEYDIVRRSPRRRRVMPVESRIVPVSPPPPPPEDAKNNLLSVMFNSGLQDGHNINESNAQDNVLLPARDVFSVLDPLETASVSHFFFDPPRQDAVVPPPVVGVMPEEEKKQEATISNNNAPALKCVVCNEKAWQPVAQCCLGVLMCRLCAMCQIRDAGGVLPCLKCGRETCVTDLHVLTQLEGLTDALVSVEQRVQRVVTAAERFSGHVSITGAVTLKSSPTTLALMRLCVMPEAQQQERHWSMLSRVLRDHMPDEASFTKDDIVCKIPPVRLVGPTGAKLTVCHPRGAQLADVDVSVLLDVMSKLLEPSA